MSLEKVTIGISHGLFSRYSYSIDWTKAGGDPFWLLGVETKRGFNTAEAATAAARARIAERQARRDEEEAKSQERRETWSIETWRDAEGWSFYAACWGISPETVQSDVHYLSREMATDAAKRAIDDVMTKEHSQRVETWRWTRQEEQ